MSHHRLRLAFYLLGVSLSSIAVGFLDFDPIAWTVPQFITIIFIEVLVEVFKRK